MYAQAMGGWRFLFFPMSVFGSGIDGALPVIYVRTKLVALHRTTILRSATGKFIDRCMVRGCVVKSWFSLMVRALAAAFVCGWAPGTMVGSMLRSRLRLGKGLVVIYARA